MAMRIGPEHHRWRGENATPNKKRARAQRWFSLEGVTCEHEQCDKPATDRHHKNGDIDNNERTNLAFLCRRHHMEIHEQKWREAFAKNGAPVRRRKSSPKAQACVRCSRLAWPLRRGRCGACSEYLRRTGLERPVDPVTRRPLVARFVGNL